MLFKLEENGHTKLADENTLNATGKYITNVGNINGTIILE